MSSATPRPTPMPDDSPPPDSRRPGLDQSLHGDLPDPTESIALVQRYHAGDGAALEALLDRYQDRIRRIVRIRLGSRLREKVESMDVVQEVNLVAFRKLKDFRPGDQGSLLHWLSRIALNQVRDQHERFFVAERRAADREVPIDAPHPNKSRPALDPAGDSGMLPEERAWQHELREILDESMTKLPAEHQEVILLRDYCGMSWNEIATEIGKSSVGAAQEFHRRAWIKLRRLVRPRLNGLV